PARERAGTPGDPADLTAVGRVGGIRVPVVENYAYSASKAGVHMLTRHLAHHLVDRHINVNAIAPGPFPSKMTAFMFEAGEDVVAASVPMGRVGRPDDVAGAAIFLSSPAGSYLTGAVIPVAGGVSPRR